MRNEDAGREWFQVDVDAWWAFKNQFYVALIVHFFISSWTVNWPLTYSMCHHSKTKKDNNSSNSNTNKRNQKPLVVISTANTNNQKPQKAKRINKTFGCKRGGEKLHKFTQPFNWTNKAILPYISGLTLYNFNTI